MATGIGNPAGFVNVFDGGAPRILTGYAREVISGGCFVTGSTAANVVSSGLNSFASDDIKLVGNASGLACNGMMITSTASGAVGAFCTRGVVVCLADGTVNSGYPVIVAGVNAVRNISVGSVASTEYPIGRALTDAGSEGFCLVHLNL